MGTATVGGTKMAVTLQRSTRGRELLSAQGFYELDTGSVTSPQTFIKAMSHVEFSFNWFYADDKHIAYFSSGRLPVRAPGTDPALPTIGTGAYEWQGFLPAHASAGNRPAERVDPQLERQARRGRRRGRLELRVRVGPPRRPLRLAKIAKLKKHTLASVAGVMNEAATQDLRTVRVWPIIRAVLDSGPARRRSARARQAAVLLDQWLAGGASRIDLNGDGKVDASGRGDHGRRLAEARGRGAVAGAGPADRPPRGLMHRSDEPGPEARRTSTAGTGTWRRTCRTLLGRPVRGPFTTRFCGAGVLSVCRDALWSALGSAAADLAKTQGWTRPSGVPTRPPSGSTSRPGS